MKIFALLFSIFALVSSAMALKHADCGLPHSQDGADGMACLGYFEKWSYHADAKECVKFVFGGCGGNANRFNSHQECENKCKE